MKPFEMIHSTIEQKELLRSEPGRVRTWLIRLGLLLFIFLFVLALGETGARILAPQDLTGTWAVLSPRGYLHNKANVTARHQFLNRVVTYRFNDYYLRGGPIRQERARVLLLGDSFRFGHLLKEEDTYVRRLARSSDRDLSPNAFEFLNGGVSAWWGTAHYLAFLEEFGSTLSPRVVVVFLNYDDIRRSVDSRLYGIRDVATLELETTETRHGSLPLVNRFVNSLPFYPWLLEHSHLVQLLRLRAEKMVRASQPSGTVGEVKPPDSDVASPASDTAYAVALGQALFRRLKGWSAVHGAQLFVLTTGYQRWHLAHPDLFRISVHPSNVAFFQQAETFFQREGIPFKDIAPEIMAASGGRIGDFIIPEDGHPNEDGSKLIAFYAWSWLRPQLREMVRK